MANKKKTIKVKKRLTKSKMKKTKGMGTGAMCQLQTAANRC